MNSFIFSFRPFLAACLTIACIETAIAMVAKPNVVERSNYLNWVFGGVEPFHKLIIHEKLRELVSSQPDIVQVGDSSGFYGIRSNVVMEYLGGLRYLNLSCCAGTGFDGYRDIAKFSADHVANLHTIVLYITFNNLPRPSLTLGESELGSTKIYDSYVGPWAFIKLPSIALRSVVTDNFYNLFGVVAPRRSRLNTNFEIVDMARSIHGERGWWAEQDPRLVGARRAEFFRQLCGDDGVMRAVAIDDVMSPGGDFLPLVIIDKFAAFAKSHDKKLIVVFHPHPCNQLDDKTMRALDSAVSALKASYSNLYVYPEGLFEHWSHEIFTGADHVRVGYEQFASRRLGRFLADALGVPAQLTPQSPPPPPQVPVVRSGEAPIWVNGRIGDDWRLDGLAAANLAGSGMRVIEMGTTGRHSIETVISGLVPNQYYLATARYKVVGDRIVHLTLRDVNGAQQGLTYCNLKAEEARRRGNFYDGGMSLQFNESVLCWGIIKLTQDSAVLGIDLLLQNAGRFYQGDGQSGLMIQEFSLFMRSSPDVLIDSGARH